MTTLSQYSLLNLLALQLAAKPAAAVTPAAVLDAMEERRLFPLLRDTASSVGADPTLIASLGSAEEEDISDYFESWANVADLTRKYSDDLTDDSSYGWIVVSMAINETLREYGSSVDATWDRS